MALNYFNALRPLYAIGEADGINRWHPLDPKSIGSYIINNAEHGKHLLCQIAASWQPKVIIIIYDQKYILDCL